MYISQLLFTIALDTSHKPVARGHHTTYYFQIVDSKGSVTLEWTCPARQCTLFTWSVCCQFWGRCSTIHLSKVSNFSFVVN